MTENEAMVLGKSLYENLTSNANNIIPKKEYIEFVGMAIQALEEIQQYRAIGTVEECEADKIFAEQMYEYNVHEKIRLLAKYEAIGTIEEIQSKLDAYKELGTMEELKALKEKSVAKKPIDKIMYLECPTCGDVGILDCGYCSVCGQKLDWSE